MVKTRHAGSANADIFAKEHQRSTRFKREIIDETNSSDSDVVSDRKRLRRSKNSPNIQKTNDASSNSNAALQLVLSDSEEESTTYTSRSGRRIMTNKLYENYDSRFFRKARHSPPGSSVMKSKDENRHGSASLNNSEEKIGVTPRTRSLRSSSRASKEDSLVSVVNGDISYFDDDSSIRRSTRQRKVVYGTLNQSWLLGTATSGAAFRNDSENQSITPTYEETFKETDMYSKVKERHTKRHNIYEEVDEKKGESSANEAESGDEESGHLSSCEENEVTHSKYHLRPKKPLIDRFQPSTVAKRTRSSIFNHTSSPARRPYPRSFHSSVHRSPIFRNRRHAAHNSSSTSSSSDDETRFERRKKKSMLKARNRFLPMNMDHEDIALGTLRDRVKIGSSLADVDPMSLDKSANFESVGGLDHHLNSLKEMILFPLMYPEIFEKFRISPPRGVLFYGPPGTGKTLVARALANECSRSNHKVAFFMRKGADCLSKWVGESERQLRLLFDQAYQMRPSIIFFDEIDGLAPVRSSRQDQIHSSIVSTLLALMDGLDNRGEVVVIGATNRIDAIDPALRRPGRFDREFNFPLPSTEARETILRIHTKDWKPELESTFILDVAKKCVGYCGADLKALCAEAAILALRRRYPQIYTSKEKLLLDISSVEVKSSDFELAAEKVVPAGHRSATCHGRPLPSFIKPFMQSILDEVCLFLQSIFPHGNKSQADLNSSEKSGILANKCNGSESGSSTSINEAISDFQKCDQLKSPSRTCFRPRLILCGNKDQGQSTYLGPAILHHLEGLPVHSLDLPSLYSECLSPEDACARIFREAKRNTPSILYLPHIDQWWTTVNEPVVAIFHSLLCDITPSTPILFLATSDCEFSDLPIEVKTIFSLFKREAVEMKSPTCEERQEWFSNLIEKIQEKPLSKTKSESNTLEKLDVAPPVEPRKLTEAELMKLQRQEENTLRELRMFLRETINKLVRDRKFLMFAKPVDVHEVPDYHDVISHPMDLETMMQKIDLHKYESGKMFLEDIDQICSNALEYNPDKGPSDRLIRHRACALRDVAYDIIETEMDPEFEKNCEDIHNKRLKRGDSPTKFAPKHYITIAMQIENEEKEKAQTVSDSEVGKKPPVSRDKRQTGSAGHIVRTRKSPWFGGRRRRFVKYKRPSENETAKDDVETAGKGDDDAKDIKSNSMAEENDKIPVSCSSPTQESQSANHNASIQASSSDGQVNTTVINGNMDCEPEEIIVDLSRLKNLVDLIVESTDGCNIEILGSLYVSLESCIERYRHVWNKGVLLKELEDDIQRFKDCLS